MIVQRAIHAYCRGYLHIQKPKGGSGKTPLSPDDDRILLFLSLSAMMKESSRDWDAFSLGSQWVW
jgi:hypothetical protein